MSKLYNLYKLIYYYRSNFHKIRITMIIKYKQIAKFRILNINELSVVIIRILIVMFYEKIK